MLADGMCVQQAVRRIPSGNPIPRRTRRCGHLSRTWHARWPAPCSSPPRWARRRRAT
ncbi:hypothetical protein BGLA2_440022 [Burkholderia gladioli]|nr:hypothetical protein BGLA2_440022 [Burkholderia gladioli]